MMRVGLNLLYLVPGETGGRETYARELVPAMLERAPELELVAFVNRDAGPSLAAELGDGIRAVELPVSPHSRGRWAVGELALVAAAARRADVELLHSMANFAPPWGPFRRVVTIHDLHYKAVPDMLSWPMRMGTSALVSLAARGADRIIGVSHAGAREISDGLGVDPLRIDVVPNGVRPAPTRTPASDVREQFSLGEGPIVLAVASNLPHKNLGALIDALALISAAERPTLVLAGHGTDDAATRARIGAAGVDQDVRLLGRCTTEELDALYATAACVVLASLHEGFGLPVLEAMARGVPVACSDIPALREVGADAAIYFDPREPAQIADRVIQVIEDKLLAHHLTDRGPLQAARFSWAAAAEGTLASYRAALAG